MAAHAAAFIWPGELTLLTARRFGVFLLALALSIAPLVFSRGMAPVLAEMRPGLVMAALIVLAAIVFIGDFNFAACPLGVVYMLGCLAALGGAGALLLMFGRALAPTTTGAGQPGRIATISFRIKEHRE
ncbi:MAG: hypothetical protein U0074_02720 [Kouleothrix sp.]